MKNEMPLRYKVNHDTPAMYLTRLAFNDINNIQNYSIECINSDDFLNCCKIIENHIQFPAASIAYYIQPFREYRQYWASNNPNNNIESIKYSIGKTHNHTQIKLSYSPTIGQITHINANLIALTLDDFIKTTTKKSSIKLLNCMDTKIEEYSQQIAVITINW